MKYSDGKNKKVIALCMTKFYDNDQVELIKGMSRVASKHGYKLFVFAASSDFIYGESGPSEEKIYDLLEPEKYEAVVMMTDSFKVPGMAQRIADKVTRSGVVCISLLEKLKGCLNIVFDYESSFELVVRHIIETHKPKHVNFIAGIKDNLYSEIRLSVFKKVMEENNLPIEDDRIGYGDFWEYPTEKVMNRFLASGKKIDAIICANDLMAIEACKKLKEAGLRVPDDVIVSGFDGIEMEKYHYPRLTTAFHDTEALSEMVISLIDNSVSKSEDEKEYSMSCSFRAGQSCGCLCSYNDSNHPDSDMSFYKVYGRMRYMENNIELMYRKAADLGRKEKYSDIMGDLFYLMERIFPAADVAILLNDDFINSENNLWETLSPDSNLPRHAYYTDTMRVAVERRNGAYIAQHDIPLRTIAPEFDELIEKDGVLMFTPINCMGNGVGYLTSNYYPDSFDFFMYFTFATTISNTLTTHKARLDQFNLYSTDQLTKLLNRKGFYKHTESLVTNAVENKLPLAIISMDLNGLKMINDTYGHKEGDFALAKVGEVLKRQVAEMGICTRFGGDEFAAAIVCEDVENCCRIIMKAIADELNEFNLMRQKVYTISASLGAASMIPTCMDDLERLIMAADEDMYRRKQAYKMMHDMSIE